jgi:hypothetical protein
MTKENEKFGVDNIIKFIDRGLDLSEDIATALEDGKVNFKDSPLFIDDVVAIPGMINAATKLEQEFLDMSPAEREFIDAHVREKVNNPNANVAEVVRLAIKTATDTSVIVQDFVALSKAIKALRA